MARKQSIDSCACVEKGVYLSSRATANTSSTSAIAQLADVGIPKPNTQDRSCWNVQCIASEKVKRTVVANSLGVIMSAAVATGRRRAPPPPAKKSSGPGSQQNYDELKLKFLTADRNYETLKQLARKGKPKDSLASVSCTIVLLKASKNNCMLQLQSLIKGLHLIPQDNG